MSEPETPATPQPETPEAAKSATDWSAFLQKVIVTIIGPMMLVVVTAWANHRFDVNEKKAEDTKTAVTDLAKTASELKTLLNDARAHAEDVRQQARTDQANLKMTVIRLEQVIRLNTVKEEVERRAKHLFERVGAAPKGTDELAQQRQMVLDSVVDELLKDGEIDEAQTYMLKAGGQQRFDELAAEYAEHLKAAPAKDQKR
jgi:hypothetical protein